MELPISRSFLAFDLFGVSRTASSEAMSGNKINNKKNGSVDSKSLGHKSISSEIFSYRGAVSLDSIDNGRENCYT